MTIAVALSAFIALGCGARSGVLEVESGATYEAVVFATGLDRFGVWKKSGASCALVVFVSPVSSGTPGVTLPDGWALESAARFASCPDDLRVFPSGGDPAEAVNGSGDWDAEVCRATVDLRLSFDDEDVELDTTDLLVPYAGCD
jgi:hypothetical protein